MKLIPASYLLAHVGLDSSPDNTAAANSAISMATTAIESRLTTAFDRASKTDVFIVTNTFRQGQAFVSRLLLSRGFITGTVVLSYAATMAELTSAPTLLEGTFVVDEERGIVTETSVDLTGKFVKAVYTHGFQVTGQSDVYAEVPAWLQDACRALALCTMKSNPSLENMAAKETSKAYIVQYENIIGVRVRYAPAAAIPI